MSASPSSPAPRGIRVFVSSTFADMQAERDELIKRVFPALRKRCESRGAAWSEVDLRWGLTDEQKAEARVLPICLDEVRGSRPFFIGLLGERYGWCPAIPPELVESTPWLADFEGRSATELEIIEGALRDPAIARHAHFYFRDPAATPDPAVLSEDAGARARLDDLKTRIRTSGLPVREGYENAKELGELVWRDFAAVIDELFPEHAGTDPLLRERAEQEAFADCRRTVYVARPDAFAALDAHVAGDGPPLVVTGDAGTGKTALLANWVAEYRSMQADVPVITHFVGATPSSTEWDAMLRRLLSELHRRLDMPDVVPDDAGALRAAFAAALYRAAAYGRLVLVIDAVNQLDDRDMAPDLAWLPPELPPNVRLVVSTAPGRPLQEALRRGWPVLRIEPLTVDERSRLIERYLARFAKSLSAARVRRIAASDAAANPLYLRALLDELRVFGVHERLDERIAHYLQANDAAALFGRILERWEEDYDLDRPHLVRDAMTLLWAAKRGLAESELLDLLGEGGNPLPHVFWSPLHLAAGDALLSRGGLLAFSHEFVRQAVADRWLRSAEEQEAAHRHLARYFEERDLSPRVVDELPWQLREAREWERLRDLLRWKDFLREAWAQDRNTVLASWSAVERNSPIRAHDAYAEIVGTYPELDSLVAHVLYALGYDRQAAWLMERLLAYFQEQGDLPNLQMALDGIIATRLREGTLADLLPFAELRARITDQLGMRDEHLASRLSILKLLGDARSPTELLKLADDVAALAQEWERPQVVAECRALQGAIAAQVLDMSAATRYFADAERIFRRTADAQGLRVVLVGQATLMIAAGRPADALRILEEDAALCRMLGERKALSVNLRMQVEPLDALGRHGEAERCLADAMHLDRERGDVHAIAHGLSMAALHRDTLGDTDGALAYFKEAEPLLRRIGDLHKLQAVLGNMGLLYDARGDLDASVAAFQEQARVCRQLGIKPRW